MTTFGQSLTPVIYQDTVLRSGQNRWDVYILVCRLLDRLGMKLQQCASRVNPLDPANATYQPAASEAQWALFFYPTTETFTIEQNSNNYRPAVLVIYPPYTSDAAKAQYAHEVSIDIEPIMVRAGNGHTFSSQWTFNKVVDLTNNLSYYSATANNVTYLQSRAGARIGESTTLRPHSGSFTTLTTTMLIQNVWGYLGPAGLFLAMGDDATVQSRAGLTRWCNFGFVFGGGRIPNRARSVPSDSNLNRINPILPLLLNEAQAQATAPMHFAAPYGGNTSTAYRSPRVPVLGMGFNAINTFTANATLGDAAPVSIFNLTNLDRPLFPVYRLNTTASPRAVSGQARHILGRMVYYVDNISWRSTTYYANDADYPLGNGIVADFHNSLWEDAWDCPSVRIADSVAPLGEYTDPDTATEWWFHWWAGTSVNIALYSEGRTLLTTLPTRAYGTDTNHPVDLTAGTDAGVTASALVAPSYNSGAELGRANTWTVATNFLNVGGQNYLDFTQAASSSGSAQAEFIFSPPVGTELEWDYFVSFSAYRRGGTENNTGVSALFLEVLNPNGNTWISVLSLASAGANSGNTMWNYAARATTRIWTTGGSDQAIGATGNIRFRFRVFQSGNVTNTLCRVGDITVIRRRMQ